MYDVDINELVLKALKYLFQGLMIAIVAYLLDMIGPNKLNTWEIAILSATAACIFAILDILSPTYAQSAQARRDPHFETERLRFLHDDPHATKMTKSQKHRRVPLNRIKKRAFS